MYMLNVMDCGNHKFWVPGMFVHLFFLILLRIFSSLLDGPSGGSLSFTGEETNQAWSVMVY